MQLSLSGFLFENDYRGQSVPFERFIEIARSAGYEGVELRDTQVSTETPRAAREKMSALLREAGLTVTCLTPRQLPHEGPPRERYFDAFLDFSEQMGCKLLKVKDDDAYWLRSAAERAAHRGIALAINTHLWSATQTISGALRLMARVDHPNYGILYDCMHLMAANEDYIGAIDRLQPYMRNVLVQCVRPSREGETPYISYDGRGFVKAPIGDPGVQDWPAVIRKLKEKSYDGWITVIENAWPIDQREHIAHHTAEYLKTRMERNE